MNRQDQRCTDLIEATAKALMLLTVQKGNMELNINRAVEW
jgi:hypothetical protein